MKLMTQRIAALSAAAIFGASAALANERPQNPSTIPDQEPVIGAPGRDNGGDDGNPSQEPGQNPGQSPGQNPGSCAAVLRVVKEGPSEALVNDVIKYRIFVTNLSQCDASGIDVVDTMPPSSTFVDAFPVGPSVGGGQVSWENQAIGAGQTAQFEVQVFFAEPTSAQENKACASQNLDPEVCSSVFTSIRPPIGR